MDSTLPALQGSRCKNIKTMIQINGPALFFFKACSCCWIKTKLQLFYYLGQMGWELLTILLNLFKWGFATANPNNCIAILNDDIYI